MNDGGFRHLPVVEDDTIWGVVSRGDFKGIEIDQLDDEEHLWECIR
jgi:CBS domain-containing protein